MPKLAGSVVHHIDAMDWHSAWAVAKAELTTASTAYDRLRALAATGGSTLSAKDTAQQILAAKARQTAADAECLKLRRMWGTGTGRVGVVRIAAEVDRQYNVGRSPSGATPTAR